MKPEQWQQIEELYHAALELEADKRPAYLAEVCAGDATLRHEVESLLGYDDQASDFIERPAVALAAQDLADEQSTMQIGQRISHYQILSLLGAGGMGEVYLAQDSSLKRQVAIKLLPSHFTLDAERVQRFEREACAASALNHPNILTIHEIGQVDTTHFIVTEYIDGQTLRQQMKAERMNLSDVLDVAIQIVSALATAHAAGIIHRDIKPENVMVRQDGIVKVLDFGLAKLMENGLADKSASRLTTEAGLVMGTPRYMSPEQARGEKVDMRSDIFSFGVMLYEMIAGRAPFEGATTSEVIAAILRDEPPPLSEHLPDCPAPLEQIVRKCLAKTPKRRYQTAVELSAELKAARVALEDRSRPTAEIAEEKTRVILQKTESLKQQWWRKAAIISAVALIALLAALYYYRSGQNTTEAAIKQIAILPPRALRSNARDEDMEMGTASMLITRLSSLGQLIVRSENAVARYASPEQDPLVAGREQKVDAVLDTRYQRSGDIFRFTLRLLRVADGTTLWADTLDLPTADLFAIQDALSGKVTSALRLTLSEAEKQLMSKRYTKSPEAWQLYVTGRHLLHRHQPLDEEKAITYFEQAIALDPGFALARTHLGKSHLIMFWSVPKQDFALKANLAINQALKLDDQLAEAHTHLAEYKHYYQWDFKSAEQEHQRALDLNPSSADVHHGNAFYQTLMGRFERGIVAIRKAEELDPTDQWISRNVAQVLFYSRRYDEAIAQSQRAIDLAPDSVSAYNWLINAYELKGDGQRAFAASLRREELEQAGSEEIAEMNAAFAASGLNGYWRRRLDRLLGQEKSKYVSQHEIALCYGRLGEKEQALARLEKSVEAHEIYAVTLNVNPHWDRYRTDPRFVALVRRVGLTP